MDKILASPRVGLLVVNADDWGRDAMTTDRILECTLAGTVSSVSAMVFMNDSERAAAIAVDRGIEAGLHLNFTTTPSSRCRPQFLHRQQQLARYLLRNRLTQAVFHPGLVRSFHYVVAAQIEEFRRLYGEMPYRLDGHHHMHLCANVLFQGLLPRGTLVRRNFSFRPGENSLSNRLYRHFVDARLARRHRLLDFFFSLPPLQPQSRLDRIFDLARFHAVELETHPIQPDEYHFLTGGGIWRHIRDVRIGPPSAVLPPQHIHN